LVAANRLGQKTKAGYYRYEGRTPKPDPALVSILQKARANVTSQPNLDKALSDSDIVDICFYPIVNEACRIIEEGYVIRGSDIDVCSVMGYGFPAFRGGVHFWGVSMGLAKIRDRLDSFAQRFGSNNPTIQAFFKPSAALEKFAST